MPTQDSAEAILRAARRARRDADKHVADGDVGAAGELFKAISDADRILSAATAQIRQATRPLSVSGFGESHDRMNDSFDRLMLTGERFCEDEDDRDEADDQWQAFVGSHPELVAPPTFTDDEILGSLRAAIESQTQPWLQGATSSASVVEILLPEAENRRATVVRTGKQLARLAREGHVVRLRQKWRKGRGGSIWSLPGIEINEWWLKQYEVSDAS